MHRFYIHDGEVTYSSRFLRSDSYVRNSEKDRIVVCEFGTMAMPDPCKNFFSRFLSRFKIPSKCLQSCAPLCAVQYIPRCSGCGWWHWPGLLTVCIVLLTIYVLCWDYKYDGWNLVHVSLSVGMLRDQESRLLCGLPEQIERERERQRNGWLLKAQYSTISVTKLKSLKHWSREVFCCFKA